jgi:hypothetical protein
MKKTDQIIIGKRSNGHEIQSNQHLIVISFKTDEGIALEKSEAASLVSGILNAGSKYKREQPAYAEITAPLVTTDGLSLSADQDGYRVLALLCGGVNLPLKIRSEPLSALLASPGDEIHRVEGNPPE